MLTWTSFFITVYRQLLRHLREFKSEFPFKTQIKKIVFGDFDGDGEMELGIHRDDGNLQGFVSDLLVFPNLGPVLATTI